MSESAYGKAAVTLEFDRVARLLADCAPTEGSRDLALRISPEGDPFSVKKNLRLTTEAKAFLVAKGMPGFGGIRDIGPALDRALRGASMTPRELLDAAQVLNTARRLYDAVFSDRGREETWEALTEIFSCLTPDRYLEAKITRAILSEDRIADEASPALADIRRRIRQENLKIRESLQHYTGGAFGKYLQENIVTLRNGRYVIPVKAEYKNEIRGLVHDTSASGATLFIEPLAVVDANNELRALQSREEHEIDRILAELSADCAACSGALSENYRTETELALRFAMAELSCRMNATEPAVTEKRRLRLIKARHPLIDKEKVVPITVELGGEYTVMVITGPNTGGKTASLKTIGLLSLMAQAGLHVPCSEGSEICLFDSVLADIGDEQSIEQSLSTFSAHMVNIVSILNRLTDRSLVLLDELGAGTDPTEGAALAVSILDRVRQSGALCAATTHYAEMKAYALKTEGVTNASCEFDVATLRPTYRLIIGMPGKSNAFAISKKLGVGEDILDEAEKRLSNESLRFENVLGELEKARQEAEKEKAEAEKSRKEFERYRAAEEERLKKRVSETEKELEKAQEKAVRILESARVTSDYVLGELEKIKKEKDAQRQGEKLEAGRRDIRSRLKEAGDLVNPVTEEETGDYRPPRDFRQGDTVLIVNLNQKGVLATLPDRAGNVTVKTGLMNTRTNIRNLRLIEEAATVTTSDRKRIAASKYQATLNKSFTASLDLRGQLGDDAWFMTDKYLDEAVMANVKTVTLIHGKGTGALRAALRTHLKSDARVKSFRDGVYGEGDAGVTVVELK